MDHSNPAQDSEWVANSLGTMIFRYQFRSERTDLSSKYIRKRGFIGYCPKKIRSWTLGKTEAIQPAKPSIRYPLFLELSECTLQSFHFRPISIFFIFNKIIGTIKVHAMKLCKSAFKVILCLVLIVRFCLTLFFRRESVAQAMVKSGTRRPREDALSSYVIHNQCGRNWKPEFVKLLLFIGFNEGTSFQSLTPQGNNFIFLLQIRIEKATQLLRNCSLW